jgi:DNA-binding NarL/FixJ family response regulator
MTSHNPRRIVIAYKTGLLGRGLQSLLGDTGSFEVVALFGGAEELAATIRDHAPHVIIVENGALSPENAQAVFNAALEDPHASVLSVSLDAAQPTLWRALGVVAEGDETLVDALRRHLTVPA